MNIYFTNLSTKVVIKKINSDFSFFKQIQKLQKREILSLLSTHIPDYSPQNLKYTSKGKPYIENSLYKISISHSKNYIALAWSQENEIGLDIELERNFSFNLAKRILTPPELEFYTNLCHGDKKDYIHFCWCIKEAAYKKDNSLSLLKEVELLKPNDVYNVFIKQKKVEKFELWNEDGLYLVLI